MANTRQEILSRLQRQPGLAAGDLAEHFELSLGAVRHHLAILERDGLIQSESVRKPIGRPCMVYELTELGEESFPKQYDRLSNALLDTLEEEHGAQGLRAFLRKVADRLIKRAGLDMKPDASIEERAGYLVEIMDREGFSLNWQRDDNELRIIQHSCPYQSVVGKHPEICQLDEQVIQTVMGQTTERVEHRSKGECACVFRIDLASE
jgi:predicted ArsR family transcriptional regulator